MDTDGNICSRRDFLRHSAVSAGALFLPVRLVGQSASSPSETVRLGLIGCGGQGRGDARNASRFGRIVAVCDVDATRLAAAQKDFGGAEGYSDFRRVLEREDIDAIICGTVDHWHTLVAMAAMKAGKDIYCEKPLTLTIDEG
ncbi:MAG: Gfo/Idh/MocA family oxidoreductase, partial [Phycisphaerales bacterium]